MLALLVLFLLLAAIVYPYLSALIFKWKTLRHLSAVSRRAGFRYRRSYRCLLFVRNRSPQYDLLIENERCVYAVKLWSAYRKGSALVVTERGRVMERRWAIAPLRVSKKTAARRHDGRKLRVPRTSFALPQGDKRELIRILLICPSYRDVIVQTRGRDRILERRLVSGDTIFDKLFYSPSAFEKRLVPPGTRVRQKTSATDTATVKKG